MNNPSPSEQISKTSHDLRNSLAVVYSHAQLLQLMLEKKKPSEEYSIVTELVGSIEQMQISLGQKMEELKEIHSNLSDPA
ncbi:hypothetical protein K2Q08_01375 [Patescibacteria group bacterium]|nr:hypothetical protein [Patescibacteria group bacterium]